MTEATGIPPEEQDTATQGATASSLADGAFPDAEHSSETPDPGNPDDISIIELIRLVITEGRDYATNEAQRQKLRAQILGKAARDAAILGMVSVFLLMGAIIALIVGLVWAVAQLVHNPLAATGIVTGSTLVLVLILLLIARARVKKAIGQTFGQKEES